MSSDANRQLIGKAPNAGKDQGQKEKRGSVDKVVGQHHRRNEQELGQTPGDGEGQGGLLCCDTWGHKESDMPGQLKNKSEESDSSSKGMTTVSTQMLVIKMSRNMNINNELRIHPKLPWWPSG